MDEDSRLVQVVRISHRLRAEMDFPEFRRPAGFCSIPRGGPEGR